MAIATNQTKTGRSVTIALSKLNLGTRILLKARFLTIRDGQVSSVSSSVITSGVFLETKVSDSNSWGDSKTGLKTGSTTNSGTSFLTVLVFLGFLISTAEMSFLSMRILVPSSKIGRAHV